MSEKKQPCVGDTVHVMVGEWQHPVGPGIYEGFGRNGEHLVRVADLVFSTDSGYQLGAIVVRGPLGQAIDRAEAAEAENERLKKAILAFGNGQDFDWAVLRCMDECDSVREMLCCCPPDQDYGCGCRSLTPTELVTKTIEELDATECSHADEEVAHAETLRMLATATAERDGLVAAIHAAGFGIMEASNGSSIHDVSEKAKADDEKTAQVISQNIDLERECEALRSQLPEGMKHCTILFRECEKGHGWLTAKNWAEHGCPTCERDSLREKVAQLERQLDSWGVLDS